MARKVQEIFDKAIYLIDAQNESTGATKTSDTREYEVRCCGLLTTLLNEVYPYSDTYAPGGDGKRPTHPDVVALTDEVNMDDFICLSVLPAGLAALFTFEEDRAKYNAFWGDYLSRLAQAKATLPASSGFEDIENPYSFTGRGAGIEHGEFGAWN